MDLLNRPIAPDPYGSLPPVPSFIVTSHELVDGALISYSTTKAGSSISPQLHWKGFSPETRSFALTCFDPDAPIPSGWWHWMILNLAPEQTSLSQGAGKSDLELDGAAFHIRIDHGGSDYFGAAPPKGNRLHRCIFAIHTLDLDTLGPDDETTSATYAAQMLSHTVAHIRIAVTHEIP